jgi:hypothetical protein
LIGPTGNWLRKGGNRYGPEEGFFCGNHFGGRHGGNRNSDLVGRRFFLWKSLRWLAEEELEANTRWKKVFLFKAASVADEGGAGSQHPLEEGFSF